MRKLLLFLFIISLPAVAQFKSSDFKGYWRGTWHNDTFNTGDSAFVTVNINEMNSTISLTMEFKGNIFEGENLGPATMAGVYSKDGFSVTGNTPNYGDMFFSGDSSGMLTGRLPDVPSSSVDSMIFLGGFDVDTLWLNFTAYYGGSTLAVGVINLKKDTSVIVPVELTSFIASVINNNVELKWITATEVNNSGFEIERKSQNNSSWIKIAFLKGYGTTTETRLYTYNDGNLPTGNYLYRLKQIDFDGAYKYSGIEDAIIGAPEKFELQQNYPNPFNPATSISFSIPIRARILLSVYNLLGQPVANLVDGIKDAGTYNVSWNAENLTSGVYIYSFKAAGIDGKENYNFVRKMILLK